MALYNGIEDEEMKSKIFVFFALFCSFLSPCFSTEINSLVIDETKTWQGQKFYQNFSNAWWLSQENDLDAQDALIVRESKTNTGQSSIEVLYKNKKTCQMSLRSIKSNPFLDYAGLVRSVRLKQNQIDFLYTSSYF